jgi:hypothetical protein
MTLEDKQNLLAAIMRMEHDGGHMNPKEYWATVHLCQEMQTPQFVTEYFARKAYQPEESK